MPLHRVKLDAIDTLWPAIKKYAQDIATENGTEIEANIVYERLMAAEMEAWLFSHEGLIVVVALTNVSLDFLTQERFLNITMLAATGDVKITRSMVDIFFETLEKFAISIGCVGISTYTHKDGLATFLKNREFKTYWHAKKRF